MTAIPLPLIGAELPIWYAFTAVAAALLYRYGTSTHDRFVKMGIPYRKPLPFIGNMMEFFGQSIVESDKYVIKNYPEGIVGAFQGKTPVIDCIDAEFLKEVTIKEFAKFADRRQIFQFESSPVIMNQVFATSGEHWKHLRTLLSSTFTSGKLKIMFPVINSCADKFVAHVRCAKSEPIIIKDYAAGFSMDVIASTAFGMELDTQSTTDHPFVVHAGTFFGIPRIKSWWYKVKTMMSLLGMLTLPQPLLALLNRMGLFSFFDYVSVDYFSDVVKQLVSACREDTSSQRKNFISMCIEKMVDLKDVDKNSIKISSSGKQWTTEGITKEELVANAVTFFSAGYETTATALQFFSYTMAHHPEIQQKLYEAIEEMSSDGSLTYEQIQKFEYLEWCVNESLRMYPPAMRIDRVALEDVEVMGIHIPKGQIVNGLIYGVHHNPKYWEKPDEYLPERFSPENKTDLQQYAYLPFGAGGRSCIASRLALLEIKVAVVKLIAAFKFEKTPETPEPANLDYKRFTGFLSTEKPLKISAIARN